MFVKQKMFVLMPPITPKTLLVYLWNTLYFEVLNADSLSGGDAIFFIISNAFPELSLCQEKFIEHYTQVGSQEKERTIHCSFIFLIVLPPSASLFICGIVKDNNKCRGIHMRY